MQVQRDIRIEQLVGQTDDGRTVAQAISRIFLNGAHIGFAGHKPTDSINFIRPGVLSDKETLAEIVAAVNVKLGGAARKVNGVPELTDELQLDSAEGIVARDDRE